MSGGNGGVAAFCCAVAGRLCCEQGAGQQRTLGARAWRLLRAVLRSARHAYCASFQVTAVEFQRRQKASSANAFVCRDSSERAFKFRARAAQRTLRQRSANSARLLALVSARAAGRAGLRGPSWSGLHLQAASKSNAPERRFRAARRDDLETKGLGARLQKQISASGGEAGPDQIVDLSAFRGGAAKEASCF